MRRSWHAFAFGFICCVWMPLAHAHGMRLHVDGARLANAAAALDVPLRAITTDVGVDAVSFGGTKAGLMLGEAVVLLGDGLEAALPYLRKQSMQLASKMRYVAAGFEAVDIWTAHCHWQHHGREDYLEQVKGLCSQFDLTITSLYGIYRALK